MGKGQTITSLRATLNDALRREQFFDGQLLVAMIGVALEFTDDLGQVAAVVADLRNDGNTPEGLLPLVEAVHERKLEASSEAES